MLQRRLRGADRQRASHHQRKIVGRNQKKVSSAACQILFPSNQFHFNAPVIKRASRLKKCDSKSSVDLYFSLQCNFQKLKQKNLSENILLFLYSTYFGLETHHFVKLKHIRIYKVESTRLFFPLKSDLSSIIKTKLSSSI